MSVPLPTLAAARSGPARLMRWCAINAGAKRSAAGRDAAFALASLATRPNRPGSPPLRRTTTAPVWASLTRRASISACLGDGLPPRLPTPLKAWGKAHAGLQESEHSTCEARARPHVGWDDWRMASRARAPCLSAACTDNEGSQQNKPVGETNILMAALTRERRQAGMQGRAGLSVAAGGKHTAVACPASPTLGCSRRSGRHTQLLPERAGKADLRGCRAAGMHGAQAAMRETARREACVWGGHYAVARGQEAGGFEREQLSSSRSSANEIHAALGRRR